MNHTSPDQIENLTTAYTEWLEGLKPGDEVVVIDTWDYRLGGTRRKPVHATVEKITDRQIVLANNAGRLTRDGNSQIGSHWDRIYPSEAFWTTLHEHNEVRYQISSRISAMSLVQLRELAAHMGIEGSE